MPLPVIPVRNQQSPTVARNPIRAWNQNLRCTKAQTLPPPDAGAGRTTWNPAEGDDVDAVNARFAEAADDDFVEVEW